MFTPDLASFRVVILSAYRHWARRFAIGIMLATTVTVSAGTISDQTFNSSDWSQLILFETGPAAQLTTGQAPSGGIPGSYRTVSHSYGGPGSIISGHIFGSDDYNPAVDGALASVSFSYDANVFDAGDSNAVAFGALLLQGGSYYRAGFSVVFPGGWQTLSFSNLSSSDFSLILGPGGALPDFSASGSAIQFGFWASNGTGIGQRTSTYSGIDNWQVTTVSAQPPPPVPSVPDQGGFALYAISALALLVTARHRRR